MLQVVGISIGKKPAIAAALCHLGPCPSLAVKLATTVGAAAHRRLRDARPETFPNGGGRLSSKRVIINQTASRYRKSLCASLTQEKNVI